jgi:HlyD family secretion protein
MKRAIITILVVAAIGAGAGGTYYLRRGGGDVHIETAAVSRGDITDAIGSTGTLQAVTTVQVGSQVSGNVAWLGVDFNSIVHKGQVIARIDPSIVEAQVEQARATLTKAEADVERSKVALADAQTRHARAAELAARSLLPASELDSAQVAVDVAGAQLRSAQASVVQSRASLNQNEVNLKHCIITAPIDGIVIQRSVDVGQTVAASLQSPTLFVIAADLAKMQVNASIDEADVGRIRPGQGVIFRVDAYPGDEFRGTVSQVRLQPVVVQNVTTYGAIIDVPNPDLRLKPGMTANLRVQIARRTNALRVPNTALRFRPTDEIFAALNQPVPEPPSAPRAAATAAIARPASAPTVVPTSGAAPAARPEPPKRAVAATATTIDQLFAPLPPVEAAGRVWIAVGNTLKPVVIRRGISDGTHTELLAGELEEEARVVTGVDLSGAPARAQASGTAGNPFATGRGGQAARAPGGGGRGL